MPYPGTQEGRDPSRILPLPEDVVAQIRSTTAINSLSDAVIGLLKNSLDAEAERINVIIDISRGGCIVEDDGIGIGQSEFREDGGLCRPYRMSASTPYLGLSLHS